MAGRRSAVAATVTLAAMAMGAAQAPAKTSVYRDPPSYTGIKKAPPTKAPPAPKPPPPVSLSAAGSFPDVLVDEAGTAHVVWNEDRGDAADVVVYCRIQRSASSCDGKPTELHSELDNDPNARYDSGGPPKIVRLGDQLLVFSKRYPVVRSKPDGASSSTVIAWSSGDGGTQWTKTPATVGKINLGQMVVIGSAEDPSILNVGVDPLCHADGPSGLCAQVFRSGEYSAAEGNLSTKTNQGYYQQLTLDEHGMPVLAVSDLDYNTFVRRWKGTGSPLDTTQWTDPAVIPADQSSVAGGPAGVFLMGKPKSGYGPYSVNRLDPTAAGYTPGAARVISAASDNVLGQLFQGPDGRLLAAWEQRDKGLLLKTTGGAPGEKPSFGAAKTIATGGGNGQIALGASKDGGGFTAYNHTAGIVGEGEIQVAGFGTQLQTGEKGIADVAGGGIVPGGEGTGGSCRELSFGQFTVEAANGCLLKGKGERSQEYVTSGEVNLWGVRIVPDAGVKIVLDPKLLQLDTTGSVRVILTAPQPVGDVVLFHGEIHRDLSKVVPGTDLFDFGPEFKPTILGFDTGSKIAIKLEKDGVHVPVDLKLPPVFGGFSGHAELVADRETGLHIDSVHIHIGPVLLGALTINSIDLDYAGGDDLWTGKGAITVPAGGRLDLEAQFAMGAFKSASFSFRPGTPIPIGPFVYLLQFGGGFQVEPVTINANATLGVGAVFNGSSPVEVQGDFTMTFPTEGPADFRLKGTVSVFMFQIGDGSLDFQTDGYAAFRGHTGFVLGPLEVDANLDGFVDAPTGQFGANLDGRVSLCAKVKIPLTKEQVRVCGGATAGVAVSNKGFAACGRINPPDPVGGFELGLTYPWNDWKPVFLINPIAFGVSIVSHFGGCHIEDYRIAPPRARAAQAGGGQLLDLPAGLPSATILVRGDGGQPDIKVTGPKGEAVGGDAPASDAGVIVTADGVDDATYVILDKPSGGTWTVTAQPGSVAVTQILSAQGYEPVSVKAKLGGRGRKRTIAYTLGHTGHGQDVAFEESGAFGTHLLGAAKGTKGTLRFAPADVKGGRRVVTALIRHDGVVTDRVKVGSFVAPGPQKPGKVRRLKARRSGSSVLVSWRPAKGAARYAVTVKGVKGTRLGRLLAAGKRKASFPVRREEKVTVQVRALSNKLRLGPARKVTLKAKR
jgi:hypothetical protein